MTEWFTKQRYRIKFKKIVLDLEHNWPRTCEIMHPNWRILNKYECYDNGEALNLYHFDHLSYKITTSDKKIIKVEYFLSDGEIMHWPCYNCLQCGEKSAKTFCDMCEAHILKLAAKGFQQKEPIQLTRKISWV